MNSWIPIAPETLAAAGGAHAAGADARPLVVSLCGTYLKPEMQSIYRQVAGLRQFRTVVFTESVENLAQFPFPDVVTLEKRGRPRARGNFILRFWFKHIVRQWPPPIQIGHVGDPGGYYHPYNLVDLLRIHSPALVHVYYGHKAVKYLPMLEEWGGRFIVSFHGVDVVKFMDQPDHRAGMRRVFERATLVLARSESLLEAVRGLGCPEAKLRLNRTPIPMDRFDPPTVRVTPADGRWRLIQACRLVAKKGLFTTVEALKLVVSEWPDLVFVVCGQGPVEARLRKAVAAAGLERNVVLSGWMSQDALLEEYRRSHVFLHPSELTETSDQEGVPNAMLEAMATGLPVVATRHGGIPEAVTDGFDGLLVAERSPRELAKAILRLLGDRDLLASLSGNAARSVREHFGLERQVANLEACYAEAIGAP